MDIKICGYLGDIKVCGYLVGVGAYLDVHLNSHIF